MFPETTINNELSPTQIRLRAIDHARGTFGWYQAEEIGVNFHHLLERAAIFEKYLTTGEIEGVRE